jgi:hypothetical protein
VTFLCEEDAFLFRLGKERFQVKVQEILHLDLEMLFMCADMMFEIDYCLNFSTYCFLKAVRNFPK